MMIKQKKKYKILSNKNYWRNLKKFNNKQQK